jgi:hypothetical protein
LLRHKFSSIAYVRLVTFNAEKRKSRKFGNLGVLSIFFRKHQYVVINYFTQTGSAPAFFIFPSLKNKTLIKAMLLLLALLEQKIIQFSIPTFKIQFGSTIK